MSEYKTQINWFPGHMTKALRMMEEQSKVVDCFLYILDARAFRSCINSSFDKIIGTKPVLYILNKSDMIEPSDVKKIISVLSAEGKKVLACDSKNGQIAKSVIPLLLQINSEKLARYKAKNLRKAIRAMVIGVPNTGKSTFINKLCGNKKTITGNRPGVTRDKQWVKIDSSLELLDTPGTLCPSFSDPKAGVHIAFIGSIKDAVVDQEQLSRELVIELYNGFNEMFLSRYKINYDGQCKTDIQADEILSLIALQRGFTLKGSEPDLIRAGIAVLDDFRKNRIGKIALEVE